MKKKLLQVLLLSLLFGLQTILGQTNVQGVLTSNTIWTKDSSPYILTSTLGVRNGITLTIEAGVEVRGNHDLLVKGNISILGTFSEKVNFRKTRLLFKSTNLSNSIIEHVIFKDSSGVQLADEAEHNQDQVKNSGNLNIKYSDFNNNSYAKTKGYHDWSSSTTPKLILTLCHIENAIVKGYYPRSEEIEIIEGSIRNSLINSDSYNWGITLKKTSVDDSEFSIGCCGANINIDESNIKNSTFREYNNYYDVNITNSKIISCSFNLTSGRLTISKSIIVSPENELTHIKAGSVNFSETIFKGYQNVECVEIFGYGSWSPQIIEMCAFQGYKNAIKVHNFQNTFTFVENNLLNISNFNFVNNSNKDISALNNYWGTDNESVIDNKIYDGLDDINLGIVDYGNYLTTPNEYAPINSPTNVFKGKRGNGTFVTWNQNTESNIAGYKIYHKNSSLSEYQLLSDVGNVTSFFSEDLPFNSFISVVAYNNEADGTNDYIEGNESDYSEIAERIFTNTSINSNNLCINENLIFNFNSNYNYTNTNTFNLELSDRNGNFDTPEVFATLSNSVENFDLALPDSMEKNISYWVRIKSTELNVVSDSFEIMSISSPDSSFELIESTCSNTSITINYTGSNPRTDNFQWNFDGADIISGSESGPYEIKWNTSGEKHVSLQVISNGCSSTTTKIISVKESPSSNFETDNILCGSNTSVVTYSDNESNLASYNWDFGSGEILSGNGAGPYTIKWNSIGDKTITLEVIENGCSSETTKTISVNQLPEPDFTLQENSCNGNIINITYNGTASASASYNWSFDGGYIIEGSGAGPYKVVWYTSGQKTVRLEVSDNGCTNSTTNTIQIKQTPTAFFTAQRTVCDNNVVNVKYTGNASSLASFNWDFDGASIISQNLEEQSYIINWNNSFGEKVISLQVEENGCNSNISRRYVSHNQSPSLSLQGDNYSCVNGNYNLNIRGANFNFIDWNFDGASVISQDSNNNYILRWYSSGRKFVTATAYNNGCTTTSTIEIDVYNQPTTPKICVISVDNTYGKNKVEWLYSDVSNVNSFGIYKETNVSNQYQLIGNVDSNQNSFVDQESTPSQRSNRYKITAIDKCGNETSFSEQHKTIHLTINRGTGDNWNLIWNNYEGISYSTYKIYRSIDDSNFDLIQEIPSNLNSYTDVNVSSSNVKYYIEVSGQSNCNVISGRNNLNSQYVSSNSNIASSDNTLNLSENKIEKIKVYPNPTSDLLYFNLSNLENVYFELTSLTGKVLKEGKLYYNDKIELTDYPTGVYLLKLKYNNRNVIKKIIKN